ncbi:MAG TPA: GNAT family N-acetyltransferase [Pedobacter sp.]|jgi:predicted GNAT family N-acyltransferase
MIQVKKAIEEEDLKHVYHIRSKVFVEEQQCPPEFEWEHEEESIHFLATIDGVAAGTARWRKTGEGYKLQRFAVLKEFRGKGVGLELVKAVCADLPAEAEYIYLHSQIQACSLYEKCGFEKEGPEFDEVGIRHYRMVKKTK